jgi:signal transduction histidine kinase
MLQYISHEIRTPLNTAFIGENLITATSGKMVTLLKQILLSLNNFSSIQNDEDLSILENCKEHLDNCIADTNNILETAVFIRESCELSLKVLNDTLTFDKIDGNMIILETEEVDLVHLVDELLQPYKNRKNKSTKVQFSSHFVGLFDDSGPESVDRFILKADKIKIRQVLKNILSNAVKFTSTGEIKIVVELKNPLIQDKSNCSCFDLISDNRIPENDRTIRISVVDTGCGVSLEQQPTIFDQYVQFNANKLQHGRGTGLGLWISKSINLFIFKLYK